MTTDAAAQLVGERVRVLLTGKLGKLEGELAAVDELGLLLTAEQGGKAFVPWAMVAVVGYVPADGRKRRKAGGGVVWPVAGEWVKQAPGASAGAA